MSLSIILLPKGKNSVELTITSPTLSPNSLDPIFRLLYSLKEKDLVIQEALKKAVESHLEDIVAFNRNSQYLSVVFEGITQTTPYPINIYHLVSKLFDMGKYSLKIKADLKDVRADFDSFSMLMGTLISDFEGRLRVELSKFVKAVNSTNIPICPLRNAPCLLEKCVFFDFDKGCLLVSYLNF